MYGSSPLTRGTPFELRRLIFRLRFIPAYAGNSPHHLLQADLFAVHPRLRGELSGILYGSISVGWFIPAYAGNSYF